VLRVDREGAEIWLAAPRGAPLAGKLSPPQVVALREALDRLHDAGEVHGSVDASHVVIDESGNAVLTWAPRPGPTATADLDRLALGRLS